jgi:hypothetical protein
VEQSQRRGDEPERAERVVDEALASEDDHPGERAHHHAGQQRQHDDEQEDRLQPARRLHEEEAERNADARGERHRLDPDEERLAEHAPVEGVARELRVLHQTEALELRRHAQADAGQQRQRGEKEEAEVQGQRQGQPALALARRPGARRRYCRISLLNRSIQAPRSGAMIRQS